MFFWIKAAAELTLPALLSPRECTRGGFCNFMHLKPISRELRRELYGRRRKRCCIAAGAASAALHHSHNRSPFSFSPPPGTALAHAPANGAPAPGIDDGTARGGGRGTENAPDASRRRPDRSTKSLPPNTAETTTFSFVFLGELLEVFVSFIPFFKTSLCRFLNKTDLQLCTERGSLFSDAESGFLRTFSYWESVFLQQIHEIKKCNFLNLIFLISSEKSQKNMLKTQFFIRK